MDSLGWFWDTFDWQYARSTVEGALAPSVRDVIQEVWDILTPPIRTQLTDAETGLKKVEILFGHLDAQVGNVELVRAFQLAVSWRGGVGYMLNDGLSKLEGRVNARSQPTWDDPFPASPPPRPSSLPPPELTRRATTPTFGSDRPGSAGRNSYIRQHGSSMPPSTQNLHQIPSTSSFRSERKAQSQGSFASERSARSSVSLDYNSFLLRANRAIANDNGPGAPLTSGRAAHTTTDADRTIDAYIDHAITQTMIGEFLYKCTRKVIGKGYSERRHKRFFWVHRYRKTLYWSPADPGSTNDSKSNAKSAYITGVLSVLDPNPMPPGLYQYSVIVSTPRREMKFTAPTKERHDIWINALQYLLAPSSVPGLSSPSSALPVSPRPMSDSDDERGDQRPIARPQSQRSARSMGRGDTWNTTPRERRSGSQSSVGGSLSQRYGTAEMEYLHWINAPYNGDD
ncbi:meiotic cell cortex C-terminal pleckstrin homology-domain-containing protein [Mycena amicta]|nr:meiotic cell cortex C-terminal pleckstrin homology-domain-containing protein [Mycena amicta]